MSASESPLTDRESVRVAIRVRPASLQERRGAFRPMIKVVDGRMLVFDPGSELTSDGHCGRPDSSSRRRTLGVRRAKNLRYAYDHVFGEDTGQALLFEQTTRPLIDYVTKGYKATVFAYGATGSGKTHTMLGSAASGPGVMVLAIESLFDAVRSAEADHSFALRLSYLEVYNETIRDLLAPEDGPARSPAGLMLRQEPNKGVTVCGLTEHEPADAAGVLEMLERGNAQRAVSETAANAQSSRSHAVLQIRLTRSTKGAGVSDDLHLGQLTLIDLAGSERASVSANRGSTLNEGANINRSLLALGNCINALSSGKSVGHVPYRDSKLTRLLKDSLGGSTKTVMIATVSPAPSCTEDTHNTLKYAHRAKTIKVAAQSRTVSVEYHVTKYQSIISKLQAEVAHWKERAITMLPPTIEPAHPSLGQSSTSRSHLAKQPSADSSVSDASAAGVAEEVVEGASLFKRIDALFCRRTSAQQQLLELEGAPVRPGAQAQASPWPAQGGTNETMPEMTEAQTVERVRAALTAALVECDEEEAAIIGSLNRMPTAERRAVLMQEMRCRTLQLENALLQSKLAEVLPQYSLPYSTMPKVAKVKEAELAKGESAEEAAVAKDAESQEWLEAWFPVMAHAKRYNAAKFGRLTLSGTQSVTSEMCLLELHNITTEDGSDTTRLSGSVDVEREEGGAIERLLSPVKPLTSGWLAASRSSLSVAWLFAHADSSGEGTSMAAENTSAMPVDAARTVESGATNAALLPTAPPPTAPPPTAPPLPAALQLATPAPPMTAPSTSTYGYPTISQSPIASTLVPPTPIPAQPVASTLVLPTPIPGQPIANTLEVDELVSAMERRVSYLRPTAVSPPTRATTPPHTPSTLSMLPTPAVLPPPPPPDATPPPKDDAAKKAPPEKCVAKDEGGRVEGKGKDEANSGVKDGLMGKVTGGFEEKANKQREHGQRQVASAEADGCASTPRAAGAALQPGSVKWGHKARSALSDLMQGLTKHSAPEQPASQAASNAVGQPMRLEAAASAAKPPATPVPTPPPATPAPKPPPDTAATPVPSSSMPYTSLAEARQAGSNAVGQPMRLEAAASAAKPPATPVPTPPPATPAPKPPPDTAATPVPSSSMPYTSLAEARQAAEAKAKAAQATAAAAAAQAQAAVEARAARAQLRVDAEPRAEGEAAAQQQQVGSQAASSAQAASHTPRAATTSEATSSRGAATSLSKSSTNPGTPRVTGRSESNKAPTAAKVHQVRGALKSEAGPLTERRGPENDTPIRAVSVSLVTPQRPPERAAEPKENVGSSSNKPRWHMGSSLSANMRSAVPSLHKAASDLKSAAATPFRAATNSGQRT